MGADPPVVATLQNLVQKVLARPTDASTAEGDSAMNREDDFIRIMSGRTYGFIESFVDSARDVHNLVQIQALPETGSLSIFPGPSRCACVLL